MMIAGATYSSACCGAPVKVMGRTTQYYVCTACRHACDLTGQTLHEVTCSQCGSPTVVTGIETRPDLCSPCFTACLAGGEPR